MERDKPRGVLRVLRAFDASFKGLAGAWREEAAFRQEIAVALLAVPAGLWLGRSGVERALLVAPVLLCWWSSSSTAPSRRPSTASAANSIGSRGSRRTSAGGRAHGDRAVRCRLGARAHRLNDWRFMSALICGSVATTP